MKKLMYIFCMIMIIFQSCRTKAVLSQQLQVDSVSSSVDYSHKADSYIIDIDIPAINPYKVDSAVNLDSMQEPMVKKILPKLNLSSLIKSGAKIHIEGHQNLSHLQQRETSMQKQAKQDKIVVPKNKVSQNVILAIVIAIFICLIVRYAKKVRK